MLNQLDHRRLQARVDRAAAALARGKRLEDDLNLKRLDASTAADMALSESATHVADALRRGEALDLPTPDPESMAARERIELQLACLKRACVQLRVELNEAIKALDSVHTTKENVA